MLIADVYMRTQNEQFCVGPRSISLVLIKGLTDIIITPSRGHLDTGRFVWEQIDKPSPSPLSPLSQAVC